MQIVRPQPGTSAKQGDTIKSGTIIRLQHMKTRKWLHSHLHASPISGNLEVSLFPPFHLFYLLYLFFDKCFPSFPIVTLYHAQFLWDDTWIEVANWDAAYMLLSGPKENWTTLVSYHAQFLWDNTWIEGLCSDWPSFRWYPRNWIFLSMIYSAF